MRPLAALPLPVGVYRKGVGMLWLILGIVLLIVAIAGGAIVHPLLFALAILALLMFFMGGRGRTAP
jgi:hypothetical protein